MWEPYIKRKLSTAEMKKRVEMTERLISGHIKSGGKP